MNGKTAQCRFNQNCLWLYGYIGIVFLSELAWIFIDTRFPVGDPYAGPVLYWILNRSETLHLSNIFTIVKSFSGAHPPLYSLLLLPVFLIFGRTLDSLFLLNLFLFLGTIYFAYRIGKTLYNDDVGIVSALLTGSSPVLSGLSHTSIMSKCAAPFVVTLFFYHLLECYLKPLRKNYLRVGMSAGFALLIHPKLCTFILLPLLCFFTYSLLNTSAVRSSAAPFRFKILNLPLFINSVAPALLLAGVIGLPWYIFTFDELLSIGKEVATFWNNSSVGYSYIPPDFLWYWHTAPYVLSWPFVLTSAIAFPVVFFYKRVRVLALWFFLSLLGFLSSYGVLAWHDVCPIVPLLTVIAAFFIVKVIPDGLIWALPMRRSPLSVLIQTSTLTNVVKFTTLIWSIFIIAVSTWGIPTLSNNAREKLGIGIHKCYNESYRLILSFCNEKPYTAALPWQEVVTFFKDSKVCDNKLCTVVALLEDEQAIALQAAITFPKLSLYILDGRNTTVWEQEIKAKPNFHSNIDFVVVEGGPLETEKEFLNDFLLVKELGYGDPSGKPISIYQRR